MAATATLSSKFQISIPKAVREEQQWEAGQEFVFIPKGKGVLVLPVSPRVPIRKATVIARIGTDGIGNALGRYLGLDRMAGG